MEPLIRINLISGSLELNLLKWNVNPSIAHHAWIKNYIMVYKKANNILNK